RPPPRSTPFPYTTLFRSHETDVTASFAHRRVRGHDQHVMAGTGRRVFRVPPPIGEVDSGRQPTFSIVIATYNAAATIAESIESADRKSTRLNSSHDQISY